MAGSDEYKFDSDELIQLSLLRDEETDFLISAGLLGHDQLLSRPLDSGLTFPYDEVILKVTAGPFYPVSPIAYEIENLKLPREVVDTLRRRLRAIASDAEATNNLDNWRNREGSNAYGIFEPAMVVLQLVRETVAYLEAHRAGARAVAGDDPSDISSAPDKHLYFLSPDAKKPVTIADPPSSTSERAYRFLHMTPRQIAGLIPSEFRVLHVEQVLRADLAFNFETFQHRLRRKLSQLPADELRRHVPGDLGKPGVADMIDHLVKSRLTFHGTQRHQVPSIVRHGFVLPGVVNPESGKELEVRCGSTYGRGVYSSPSAEFALSYSNAACGRTSAKEFFGLKLLACATIMGRARAIFRDDNWREHRDAYHGADSHVGNSAYEYVVFDAAQIIPVYVIHLDWGADNAEYFQDLPDDPREWVSLDERRPRARLKTQEVQYAGDRQRAREAVFAKAAKYFPYGYGPATGTKFVVEEVGEASEDEEEYGDYQALRVEPTGDRKPNMGFWAWVKAGEEEEEDKLLEGSHAADEYADNRRALKVPQGFGGSALVWDQIPLPDAEGSAEEDLDDGFHLASLMLADKTLEDTVSG